MGNFISEGMALEQTLEHVSHDDEMIGGEGCWGIQENPSPSKRRV
jgi:hypothetical protein